ncbi:MAG: tol-pal system protein YbgF [Castellaniella sp.]|uniref:tol-pal system protein YbgF n=1 Tax=Castellaniella sp. TaxID=1955812 RepID=UPI0011FA7141|nr:tol-pal system protein YbgF [Castellaniella sp.]TAN27398.1 MAG: tol-pal system protein YbgF [Castellaniella sp.]
MHAFTHRLSLISAATLIALSVAAPAQAFSDDEARQAILELRAQVNQLKTQNQQGQLQLADQVDMMRQEIATLRGRVEELNQMVSNSQHGGSAQPENGPQQQANNQQQQQGAGDPQEQAAYSAAADLYRGGRYKEAASAFSTFISSYPDSNQATDARFYLGSSQYASKDFKHSIQTMQALVKAHPDSPKAPDALLVTAADQIELNDMKGAKASLQRITKEYPKSSAAETAKSRLKLL